MGRRLERDFCRCLAMMVTTLAPLAAGPLGCRPSAPLPSQAFELARSRGADPAHEWRSYLGDAGMSHASPLDQIHRGNVASLEVAWRYDAGGSSRGSQIQFNPLVVKGVLYGISPTLRLFALDASSGEELWSFDPQVERRPWMTTRGASYWSDGTEERLFFGTGPYLHAVDARSGLPLRGFGDNGRIDLRLDLGRDVSGDVLGVVATPPAAIFEDLLIIGGRVNELDGAAPGHVRAYDVRSGALRWTFHTIPQPGEFGHDTWPPESWQHAGGANSWAGISIDAERGIAFVPTGSATPDFLGAKRVGDNLFANSLVALDAHTGERRWHYQVVRHDLWDRDLPAPPNLVEVERDGRRTPAVAQLTKTGHVFVFDRESGEPLFPIREEPVPAIAIAGERPAKSQPLPTLPPPFVRSRFDETTITDRSPAAADTVRARIEGMAYGDLYTPPTAGGTVLYPGFDGGAEWGGGAWDAESGLLYVNANQVPALLRLVQVPADQSASTGLATGYAMACAGCHGLDMRGGGANVPSLIGDDQLGFFDTYRIIRDGRGRMPGLGAAAEWWQLAALAWYVSSADEDDTPAALAARSQADANASTRYVNAGYQGLVDDEGLPGSKPPWGTLTAIDLNVGEHRWQIPLGDYPAVLDAGGSGLGAENYGGPVVTAGGLLFLAATPDAKLRAFDKADGQLLWEASLPAPGFATPAVYEADGRQFVVIAAGGGKLGTASGSHYVAFALPR